MDVIFQRPPDRAYRDGHHSFYIYFSFFKGFFFLFYFIKKKRKNSLENQKNPTRPVLFVVLSVINDVCQSKQEVEEKKCEMCSITKSCGQNQDI